MAIEKPTILLRTTSDVEKVKALAAARARESFHAFRRMMRPGMFRGWWVETLELELQRFYEDFVAGRRPRRALMAPPQHGKSWAATDFIAWVAGKNPDWKTIFASYSTELGIKTNLDLQRMLTGENYRNIFGRVKIGTPGWQCNTDLIEFVDYSGSFRDTTVDGQINGMELHLGVIDDPVKGRAEASSRVVRDKIWSWFTDDYLSRFAKDSALLIIMTRWHVDDLLGRYIKCVPGVKVLRYPAIAEQDEEYRRAGEALFPELKPLEFLLERKRVLSQASWESEYQQNPIIVGGGIFPIDKLQTLPFWDRRDIKRSVRYWDKAGTGSDDAAFTVGVLMHMLKDGRFVIEHVIRGRWSALEREQKVKLWAERDHRQIKGGYEIGVEQEPGSGGKESAENTIRNLAGYRVFADRVTGSKEVRAEPFAAQVQAVNVWLIAGDWHRDFLDELESFPSGPRLQLAQHAVCPDEQHVVQVQRRHGWRLAHLHEPWLLHRRPGQGRLPQHGYRRHPGRVLRGYRLAVHAGRQCDDLGHGGQCRLSLRARPVLHRAPRQRDLDTH
jgi:predicted phage terminase large subunit-like protein